MLMRTDEFRTLYAYNRWATQRVLGAVSKLSDEAFRSDMGNSFPSIRDTLVHMMSAEWVWLSRWQGTSPTAMPEQWKELDLSNLQQAWTRLDDALQGFVARLQEAELDRPLSYHDMAGTAHVSTLAQMLRHVVNHSSYHRGQVTTMLRQLGMAAAATDLILYYRLEDG